MNYFKMEKGKQLYNLNTLLATVSISEGSTGNDLRI
jgi:hypothetical protein